MYLCVTKRMFVGNRRELESGCLAVKLVYHRDFLEVLGEWIAA